MIVVFAEKPSQAKDYAFVLGAKDRKDGYFLGNGYAVIWAFGHLVEICRPAEQNPVWKNPGPDLLPLVPDEWQFKVSDDKKKQFGIVKKLFNSNSRVVSFFKKNVTFKNGESILDLLAS